MLLILSLLLTLAQERPDLSGTWAAQSTPGVWGAEFTIDHKGQAFTVQRTFSGSLTTIPFVLDGSEVNNRMPGRLCMADSGGTWTSSWDGNAVMTAMISALPPNGKPIRMDVRSALRMQDVDTLQVEVTANGRTNATLYKRSGPPVIRTTAMPVEKARASIAQMEWLSGVWSGPAGSSTVEERWTPPAGGAMLATSRTMRDGLLNAFEFLCIVERDGGLVYQAMPNGRQPATDFTLTKIDADNAVFENPAHDFPKMIRYSRKPDGSLEATISGAANQRPQTFVFKKQF